MTRTWAIFSVVLCSLGCRCGDRLGNAATDPLELPGTFNELITRSLTTKKPVEGWPKEGK